MGRCFLELLFMLEINKQRIRRVRSRTVEMAAKFMKFLIVLIIVIFRIPKVN